MQRHRSDEDAAGDEPRDQLGRERPPGTRHLGTAGLVRVDVLIRRQRPATGHVAVADRLPVLGEIRLERSRQVESREPQARSRQTARGCAPSRPPGSSNTSPTSTPSNGASPRRSSTIHSPSMSAPRAGVESRSSSSSPSARVAASAAARVADVFTTSRSPGATNSRQVVEAGVLDRLARPVGDEQPNAVAAESARLGRLVRLQAWRQLERESAHAEAPTTSRAR